MSNKPQYWSEAEIKRLKALYLQKKSYQQIADAIGRSRASVDRTIARLRQTGDFPDRPSAKSVFGDCAALTRSTRYHAEIRMLEQVNAIGGFPVRRNVTVRGQTFAVWVKRDSNELHPLYRAKAFGAELVAA